MNEDDEIPHLMEIDTYIAYIYMACKETRK